MNIFVDDLPLKFWIALDHAVQGVCEQFNLTYHADNIPPSDDCLRKKVSLVFNRAILSDDDLEQREKVFNEYAGLVMERYLRDMSHSRFIPVNLPEGRTLNDYWRATFEYSSDVCGHGLATYEIVGLDVSNLEFPIVARRISGDKNSRDYNCFSIKAIAKREVTFYG